MTDKPIKIFISYAKEDLETATRIYHDLKKDGMYPWLDKMEIKVGHKWEVRIRKAINECDYFLALLSNNSISKTGFVQKELKIALNPTTILKAIK